MSNDDKLHCDLWIFRQRKTGSLQKLSDWSIYQLQTLCNKRWNWKWVVKMAQISISPTGEPAWNNKFCAVGQRPIQQNQFKFDD